MSSIKWSIIDLFFIFTCFNNGFGTRQLHLGGKWKVKNENNSIVIPATVPGGIYSDLTSAGLLQDIYYRFNDIEYRWVGRETWIYTKRFRVDIKDLNYDYIGLIFEGLDTFSVIYLNNQKIGESNNMYLRYTFDIKPFIKDGINSIAIKFLSAINVSQTLYDEQAKQYIVPPMCVPKEYNGECHVNLIRKMQASFSWDWGPAFPSVGIWKSVYIEFSDSAVLRDVIVNILLEDNWIINLNVYFGSMVQNTIIEGQLTTDLITNLETVSTFTDITGYTNENGEFLQKVNLTIPKLHVDLWWPNGYGNQRLYDLKLIFTSANKKSKSVKKIKIGFRKIELVQNSLGDGLTFYFKINNIPIFAKGSNWLPANILPEHGARTEDIQYLLQSAKDVHMNMLRVWGGGVYESDKFYTVADELGILIWQDFMFACSMYPVYEHFLQSVKSEVRQQVRRLQHHPSIILWAGNNENEAALQGNWYNTNGNFSLYKEDYIKLYVNTIQETCLENDITRSFAVSSPSNGLESEREGYIAKNPYDGHFGDLHYYNYLLDGWNQNIYIKTRFASEYGYQSLPSLQTMQSATNVTSDLKFGSEFLLKRQHHNAGYAQMTLLINQQLTLPDIQKDNYLDTFIYYSQISQAMAVKAETEFYRQWRSRTDSAGNGYTMGALYWQLNDVWQAPSWSSIDFNKRWKMLHYFAKKFFHPVLVSANIDSAGQMTIYIISDLTATIPNATLTVSVYKWDSFKPVYSEKKILNILPGYSTTVHQVWLDQFLVDAGCGNLKSSRYNCFVYFELKCMNGSKIGYENFVFTSQLKHANGLKTPNLKVNVLDNNSTNEAANTFNISVVSDTIAPFVWLETVKLNGTFSDNGFIQITKYKFIQYKIEKPITLLEFQTALKCTSLLNNEHM